MKVIITKSTIRRDLQLEDVKGVDCLPNAAIFEQVTLIGYEKISEKITFYKAFFSPQWKFLIHIILQCIRAKTTAWNEFSSTMASVRFVQVFLNNQLEGMANHNRIYVTPCHTKKIFRNMRRVGKDFSGRLKPLFLTMMTSVPTSVVNEAVNEEIDDSLERDATTATSLDVEQDRGNIFKTNPRQHLISLVPKELVQVVVPGAKKPWGMLLLRLDLHGEEVFVAQQDENVVEKEVDAAQVQAKIDADYELAQRLQAEGQEELTDAEKAKLFMQFSEKRKLFNKAMKKVNTFVDFRTELMEKSSKKAKAEITKEGSSKKAGDELEQERSKKQKVEDDKEFEELKKCLEIIPDDGDDVTINATPLFSKSPTIVDYKIYQEGKKSYFKIFKTDGNSQIYLTFSKMLKNFSREDLEVLWRLVKAGFEKVKPVDHMDSFLLHNLKIMFEHHVKDNMFDDVKLQVDYECEMAYELLRLVKKQLKEGYVPQ
nr:hypothetical protein [Tanacetum cinerariifolium]